MDRGGKGKTAIPEEKADEPSILPMTPESKQLAAVIATAAAPAMAGTPGHRPPSGRTPRYPQVNGLRKYEIRIGPFKSS